MNLISLTESINLAGAAKAFSAQSGVFDQLEEHNEILQWMRKRVHTHCMKYFKPGERILELNCGTGIDAIFFAEQSMNIYATDISESMLTQLENKINLKKLNDRITFRQCSYTQLHRIGLNHFDHIFSDFGGLNCVKKIDNVIAQFKTLLRPGGTVTLVIMPPVCPWEILLALKGNYKTAFRRFKKSGVDSNVEGIHFKTYYFTPSRLVKAFGKEYRKLDLTGFAAVVPPPYLEDFPKQHPRLFNRLCSLERNISTVFPFNRWADHFMLTMKLK